VTRAPIRLTTPSNKGGTYHKPGLNDPLTNCVACHGADLRGGTTGVSCFKCHGQKW
jgi:mono/diheme cytochrome c family protein